MKTMMRGTRSFLAIASVALLSLGSLSSCDKDDDMVSNNGNYTISSNASGSQMVPVVAGNGSGTMTGTYDPNTRIMTYTTNWSNLSGGPTSGGFYAGASGANGTVVGTPWSMGTGLTGTGSYNGTMTLTPAEADQMLGGGWYYSMGTAANTGGEVRGQIAATR